MRRTPNAESRAWRKIARTIASGKWRGSGLCREIRALRYEGLEGAISDATDMLMRRRVEEHLSAMPSMRCDCGNPACRYRPSFAFPFGEAAPRVLAALFLALEAEDDEEEASHA